MGPTTEDSAAYRAPWWLPGRHAQTIVPALLSRPDAVRYARERWTTPDGDFIEVDRVVDQPAASVSETRPLIVIFHGLEGSAESRYMRGLMATATALGWQGIAPHFRGCGGALNDKPRFYHSGDSAEVDWILGRLSIEIGGRPLIAVGISLGGNMLLKWLGEQGPAASDIVSAAAAISAPMDLTAGGNALGHGLNRIYTAMFLRTLKAKSRAKLVQYPGLFDRQRMEAARNLHDFDDVVTAPLHGFVDADDYWRRASSKPLLRHIAVPTLVLNAKNDPFLPASALPSPDEVSATVTLDFPDEGGHVGFLDAGEDGERWMARRVIGFLAQRVASHPTAR